MVEKMEYICYCVVYYYLCQANRMGTDNLDFYIDINIM